MKHRAWMTASVSGRSSSGWCSDLSASAFASYRSPAEDKIKLKGHHQMQKILFL
jgi:hypothetical protein